MFFMKRNSTLMQSMASSPTSPNAPTPSSLSIAKTSTHSQLSILQPSAATTTFQTLSYSHPSSTSSSPSSSPTLGNQKDPSRALIQQHLCKLIEETTSQYQIHFESCLSNETTLLPAFKEFLKFEHNLSALDFILITEEYMMLLANVVSSPTSMSESETCSTPPSSNSPMSPSTSSKQENNVSKSSSKLSLQDEPTTKKQQLEKIQFIVEKFLSDYSKDQINVSNSSRSEVLKRFEELNENIESMNDNDIYLFEKCKQDVYLELRNDNFARFLQSPYFSQAILSIISQDLSIPKKTNMLTPEFLQDFMTLLEFQLSTIGEKRRNTMANSSSNNCPTSPSSSILSEVDSAATDFDCQSVDSTSLASSSNLSSKKNLATHSNEAYQEVRHALSELLLDKKQKIVTGHHFDIFKKLNNMDGMWQQIHKSKHMATYKSKEKFVTSKVAKASKGILLIKEVLTVEATPEELLSTVIDSRISPITEPTVTQLKFKEFIEGGQTVHVTSGGAANMESAVKTTKTHPVACSSTIVKTPWPLSDREVYCATCIRREFNHFTQRQTDYTIFRKSYDPEEEAVAKGCVRALFYGATIIEQLNEKECKISGIAFIEAGGKVAPSIWNKILTARSSQVSKNLRKGLESRRKMSEEERKITSENSLRKIDTLI
ncbi:hypothetical protein C9374_000353 [Naegleria lovaniensis]|uniref:RGS domain-containing protein n=1 Tax=Naegleria lovaniensis TaxID=51637 RepID=A0AA88KPB1_NAELO|nr:uncharacterized protein C9374_000353 [Naegleria lovaniensis]KAG2388914.1 hypothetical protein C9374_000353 [Naegleria lovaniensis]